LSFLFRNLLFFLI